MAVAPAQDPKTLADRVFRLGERIGGTQTGLRRIRQDFLQMLVTEPGLGAELKPESCWMDEAAKKIISL